MYKVCVLMSTYNGEKYIEEQINTILGQIGVQIKLIIRDDGSTDGTTKIIRKLMKNNDNIKLYTEKNIGCESSFFKLLYEYVEDSDYYAFADQDDSWEKNKLIASIECIKNKNQAMLVASNLKACNQYLEELYEIHDESSFKLIEKNKKYNWLLNMHGCVLVWNKELQLLLENYHPKYICAHDVWVCAVANSIGKFDFIKESYINYRLHDNNVSGFATSRYSRIKKAIKIYWGKNHPERNKIAQELLNGFEAYMDNEKEGYCNIVLLANYKKSFIKKIKLLTSTIFTGIPIFDKIFWQISILMGMY